MSIAVSAVVRPSRVLALLSLLMGVVLLTAAMMLERAAGEPLHHGLALVCAIASGHLVLFPLRRRKDCRIDVTGIGQIRLVDTSPEAEAALTTSSVGDGEVVQLLRGSTFWSSLMVLCLQTGSGRKSVLIILPDSMERGAFRALSVACRWITASHSRHAATSADFPSQSD